MTKQPDTGDILAQAASAGQEDPDPTPVAPGDPGWVEPATDAVPVPEGQPAERVV